MPSNIKVKKARKIGARKRNDGPLSVDDLSKLKNINQKKSLFQSFFAGTEKIEKKETCSNW